MHTYVNIVVVGPRRFPQVMLGPYLGQQHLKDKSVMYAVLRCVQNCLALNFTNIKALTLEPITATFNLRFMFVSNQPVH